MSADALTVALTATLEQYIADLAHGPATRDALEIAADLQSFIDASIDIRFRNITEGACE